MRPSRNTVTLLTLKTRMDALIFWSSILCWWPMFSMASRMKGPNAFFFSREAKQISVTKIIHKTNSFSILHSQHKSFNFCGSNLMFVVRFSMGSRLNGPSAYLFAFGDKFLHNKNTTKLFFTPIFFPPNTSCLAGSFSRIILGWSTHAHDTHRRGGEEQTLPDYRPLLFARLWETIWHF